MRLTTVLRTVIFTTTMVRGTELQESLLRNMFIDYYSNVMQVLNMEPNRSLLLKNVPKMWYSEYLWCFQLKNNDMFWIKNRFLLYEQLW